MTRPCEGVALVTGAGRGIGRAVAIRLAERGLDVALVSRSATELEETRAAIEPLGRRALVLPCDVSKSSEVDRAANATVRELGTPRVVVSSAGIVRRALVKDTTEEDWDRVMDVNLKGTFLVTRALLPSMLEAKRGRFVAIASISATIGSPRQSAYAASKWGVVGFTKSLAEELRETGLQTLAVLPGSVSTAMLEGSGFPARMTPEEVAGVVVYAALDAPDAMNGSAIEVFGP
jgi:NAD(P)-dependent dehydrogenase (short-subunit alcohol dehydrogenase family)